MTLANEYNPFSPVIQQNPYPYYAALRETAPVHRVDAVEAFVLSRHEDVTFALKNHALFSSGREASFARRLLAKAKDAPEEIRRSFTQRSLIAADPPLHTQLRGLVSKAFTPRRVAELEPRIRAVTRELLQAFPARGEVDLIRDLGVPLPVIVISEMLGIEPARRLDFKRWSDDLLSTTTLLMAGKDLSGVSQSSREMRQYMEGIMELRRQQPADDLISALVAGGQKEDLTAEDIISFCRLLLIAGNETTTNLIGNGMIALLENPEQMRVLRERPALIPNAVEEMLRYDPPAQALFRQTTEEVTLSGVRLPAGTQVMPLIASANRDSRRFPDGERFDVTRDAQGQIAFGYGIHFCIGAPLARLEARVVLEELLATVSALAYAPGQRGNVTYMSSGFLRGPTSLQLSVERV